MSSNRFDSFAPERTSNIVKWHVDGHDFLYAVSEMLEGATKSIFIMDWWLSPELYLRRPPSSNYEWRLDRVLKRKAELGVKIFVAVYNESTVMPMDSDHTITTLTALHKNISAIRSPGWTVQRWSHHEKVIVVDNRVASIGGLDLCYGRWDTNAHPLADLNVDITRMLFPGQDYNNAREKDFEEVRLYAQNTVSVLQVPRMPWHDVHMTFTGESVQDVVAHFVQRWKHFTSGKESREIDAFTKVPSPDLPADTDPANKCRVQVVRSATKWSSGLSKTETSVQKAYIDMISKAEHYIYIENQFFLTIHNYSAQKMIRNGIANALYDRIVLAAEKKESFKIIVVVPEVPGFAGGILDSNVHLIMIGQFMSINRGGYSLVERLKEKGIDADNYIQFYNLRTSDRINLESIRLVEKDSGIKFDDLQAAVACALTGDGEKLPSKLFVPQPNNGGKLGKSISVQVPSIEHAQYTIAKWLQSAAKIRQTHPDQTPGAELESYVSEMVYVHSKLMIVDDRRVIMGSANINDRSQLGERDSEICLVVENEINDVETTMAGKQWNAGRFASSLRRQLYREHLGLFQPHDIGEVTSFMHPAPVPLTNEKNPDDARVADPLGDIVQVWEATAKQNRAAFEAIFKPLPSDSVRNKESYRMPNRFGHVADGVTLEAARETLSKVRGTLVTMPLRFMEDYKDFLKLPRSARFSSFYREIFYTFPVPPSEAQQLDPSTFATGVLESGPDFDPETLGFVPEEGTEQLENPDENVEQPEYSSEDTKEPDCLWF